MARPKIYPKITPEVLEKQIHDLAAINCTWQEICTIVGMKERTLKRRYGAQYKKGLEAGKMSLKRKMFDTAIGGNVTMMIWLSKQMLGYTDKVDNRSQINHNEVIEVKWADEVDLKNEKENSSSKKN